MNYTLTMNIVYKLANDEQIQEGITRTGFTIRCNTQQKNPHTTVQPN